ncbi:uncharacterized protein [Mycetomoellerius zeteki]|uniref:uncharacterized protein n=1 Tax=Mycetomoellerius zeteki TaxID=64791 RepID=UPI00084E9BAA|nr:PREDICTED: uncharacterized protein LOC108725786 [Trachymyrmex zeteki]
MPTCCVKNCKNRTSSAFYNNVVFYSFPQDADLRRKWLEACGKDLNHQIKHERVCGVHFKPECVLKSQSTLVKPRIRYLLKRGSVPTELLELPNIRQKRYWSHQSCTADESTKKSFCSGIPSYTELVAYAKTVDEKDTVSVLNNDTENVQVSDTDEKDIVSILNDDIKDVKVFDTDAQEKRIDLSKDIYSFNMPTAAKLDKFTNNTTENNILKSAKETTIKCVEGYNTFYVKVSYP